MNKAFYGEIKKILSDARNKVYQTANFAMVEAYWQIGKSIVEEQNGEERAEYGTGSYYTFTKVFIGIRMRIFFCCQENRITFDGCHFRIDLVFYNYILKCFVLIDLKIGDLTHQDLGQMQMYVHYYERELMNEGDNPPIGIVLCADKSDAVVRYTLPEGETQVFASKYKLYLPSEEELLKELKREYQAMEAAQPDKE